MAAPAPVQTRSKRFRSTSPEEFGAVTGREFEWKFAPVDRLAVLTEGRLDGAPTLPVLRTGRGASIRWIPAGHPMIGRAGAPEDRASANAWSAAEAALLVRMHGDDAGVTTIHRGTLGTRARAGHLVIHAEAGSSGTVVLSGAGPAVYAENVEMVIDEGAQLTVVTVQEWDDTALHLSSHFATVGRDANLRHVIVSLGGSVVRVNPAIHLVEQGASTDAFGLYFADAGQFLEQRPYIDHVAANTRSRVNYKGALQGKGAHTVWVGDVLIGPHADGTDSYEQNRNLVLSEGTRADSIPNLEIETGNIVGAGHASSTGRFDDEQLFYLQSRGISQEEARRLVVRGFLAEIIQQIGSPALGELRQSIRDRIEDKLRTKGAACRF